MSSSFRNKENLTRGPKLLAVEQTHPNNDNPAPKTFHQFLALPLELREKIYAHALFPCRFYAISVSAPTHPRPIPPFPSFLPALALTSRAQRHEVSRVLLRLASKIVLPTRASFYYFTAFLASLLRGSGEDWNPFGLIQALEYTHASDIDISRFPNLSTLELGFHARCNAHKIYEYGADIPTANFNKMLQCKSLHRVRLVAWTTRALRRGRHTTHFNTGGIDELAGLRELGVWMKERLSEDAVVNVVSRKDVQGHGMNEAEEVL
jgi:hypothetical protein